MAQPDAELFAKFDEKAKYKSAYQLHQEGWFSLPTAKRLKEPAKRPKTLRGKVRQQVVAYLEDRPEVGRSVPCGTSSELVPYWLREWEQMQAEPGLTGIARQLRISELNATLRDYAVAKLAEAASRAEESAAVRARAAERAAPPPQPGRPKTLAPGEGYVTPPRGRKKGEARPA